jgi:hypothetical protein
MMRKRSNKVNQTSARAPVDLPLLFSLNLHLPEFARAWQHCDGVSNFLGKAMSIDKEDSFRYENLLSTIINEILESLYHRHGSDGSAELAIGAEGSWLEFSILFEPDSATAEYYEGVGRILAGDKVAERYEESLLDHEKSPPGLSGLLELAASYDARIRIHMDGGARMKIAAVLDMNRLLKE